MKHSTLLVLSLLSLTQACAARAPRSIAYGGSEAHRSESYASSAVASVALASSASADEADAPRAPAPQQGSFAPIASGGSRPQSARAAHGAIGGAPVRTTAVTDGTGPRVEQASVQPMLIYTAQLSGVVDHVPTAIDRIVEELTTQGGFLAARTDASVTVRVPVGRFREALGRIESIATVVSRQVQAEDVTEGFHDLEVQLANLRSVHTRLQQFLARAASVQDALAVERELERVGQQIDQIEGRMRFLSNRAAFSTITVGLSPRSPRVTQPAQTAPLYGPIPEAAIPFEVLDQLGLVRLLLGR